MIMLEIPYVPHPVACPCCQRTLFLIGAEAVHATFPSGALFTDGDIVPLWSDLTEAQRRGGWAASLFAGACPFCRRPVIGIEAQFIEAVPEADFEHVYFHCNGDRGWPARLIARQDGDEWLVQRFETPLGPLFEHSFGPFADIWGGWIGESGVAACHDAGPFAFARGFLLARWNLLRAVDAFPA